MKRFRILKMVLLLLAFPATALADTVQGVITRTSPMGIEMTVYDQNGYPYPNGIHLKLDRRTRMNGVPSQALLRTNDYVKADVREENDGTWRADSVTRLGVSAQPQQQQGSLVSGVSDMGTRLMDALKSPTGQRYVKSSLTGAAVGGVSAMASGGKGGKGALFGAGLGAVATLIQDLFNQRAQQPTQQAVYQQPAYSNEGYVRN